MTNDHYVEACNILQLRYGREDLCIFRHIGVTWNYPSRSNCLQLLRKLQDKIVTHVRSLNCLGITTEEYGVFLTPIILSCLPYDLSLEWSRGSTGKEKDVTYLMTFIDKQIKLRETCNSFKNVKQSATTNEVKKSPASATTLLNNSEKKRSFPKCEFCLGIHHTHKCFSLTKIHVSERRNLLKQKGICFRCLSRGHIQLLPVRKYAHHAKVIIIRSFAGLTVMELRRKRMINPIQMLMGKRRTNLLINVLVLLHMHHTLTILTLFYRMYKQVSKGKIMSFKQTFLWISERIGHM